MSCAVACGLICAGHVLAHMWLGPFWAMLIDTSIQVMQDIQVMQVIQLKMLYKPHGGTMLPHSNWSTWLVYLICAILIDYRSGQTRAMWMIISMLPLLLALWFVLCLALSCAVACALICTDHVLAHMWCRTFLGYVNRHQHTGYTRHTSHTSYTCYTSYTSYTIQKVTQAPRWYHATS